MEFLKVPEKTWSIQTGASFVFKKPQSLDDFFEFVTNRKNAHLVLSSGLYQIDPLDDPGDPETLRKEGAVIHCQGKILLLGDTSLQSEADFEVTEFEKGKKVALKCSKINVAKINVPAKIKADWQFVSNGEHRADLDISLGLKLPGVLFSIVPFLPGQDFVDREMAKAAQRISDGFKQSLP